MEKHVKCNVCHNSSAYVFNAVILNKYNVAYYFCDNCEHLQTEKPYWIKEAYNNAISTTDTGIMNRNISMRDLISKILFYIFDCKGKFLEYAGGYGILTRMMRDIGFDFYWSDKYAFNIFAKGFEYDSKSKIDVLTAIEVFEHLEEPIEGIKEMFIISNNILFSQSLLPQPVPKPNDWWYYSIAGGQHINFYTQKTLKYIASVFDKNYVSYRDLHMFTDKNISQKKFTHICKSSNSISVIKKMQSKTIDDMNFCISLINGNN